MWPAPDVLGGSSSSAGIRRNPGLGAMTCYFLAFKDGASPTTGPYQYAHRPTGGPHALACIRNVYGDGNAIFRTSAFRAVGGYETDRDSSFEDWEAFVKLVHAGHGVGVLPEHLFYYRHRESGFSRVTDDYRNRQRVLRQFLQLDRLPPAERAVLWNAMVGFHHRADQLRELMRYRLADPAVYALSCCGARAFDESRSELGVSAGHERVEVPRPECWISGACPAAGGDPRLSQHRKGRHGARHVRGSGQGQELTKNHRESMTPPREHDAFAATLSFTGWNSPRKHSGPLATVRMP